MTTVDRVVSRLAGAAALAVLAIGSVAVVEAAETSPQSVVASEPDWGAPATVTLIGRTTPKEPDWD